jgi:hypothetical protein
MLLCSYAAYDESVDPAFVFTVVNDTPLLIVEHGVSWNGRRDPGTNLRFFIAGMELSEDSARKEGMSVALTKQSRWPS